MDPYTRGETRGETANTEPTPDRTARDVPSEEEIKRQATHRASETMKVVKACDEQVGDDGHCDCSRFMAFQFAEALTSGHQVRRLAEELARRIEKLEAALGWYGEKAEAISRYMTSEPPKDSATLAVVTELQVDAGMRARALLGAEGDGGR